MVVEKQFQSAISRYLVSDAVVVCSVVVAGIRFNPLYRGTCFPTYDEKSTATRRIGFNPLYRGTWVLREGQVLRSWSKVNVVSIRYIAVLGF